MTIRSVVQLLAQADITIEDNASGSISAADVRNMIKDFLDTINPAYGVIVCTSVVEPLTAAPQVLAPFTSAPQLSVGYFTANLTNGSVTRTLGALAGATVRVTINGDVEGANNAGVTVELFVNGVATGFKTTVSTRGATNPVSCNIAGVVYNAVNATLDVRATTDTAGNFTFLNVVLLCENVPVSTY